MKKLLFTSLMLCFGMLAKAEYNATGVIYGGEGTNVNYWYNNQDWAGETLSEESFVSEEDAPEKGLEKYLVATRVQNDGGDWHGIGFALSELNTTLSEGNQIALWVKKDIAENVKLELQFADGSENLYSELQWVAPEDGWRYLVFDFSNAENQDKTLSTMYLQLHTGGNDGVTATIEVTGIVKGFDLAGTKSAVNETSETDLMVYAQNGVLYVNSENGASVYDISGNLAGNLAAGTDNISVSAGIYIVKSGNKAVKVNVK